MNVFRIVTSSAILALGVASSSMAASQETYKGYTILHNYLANQQQQDICTEAINKSIADGDRYYQNYQDVTYKGGNRLAIELGSYYTYVYAPAFHESGRTYYPQSYNCFTLSQYDPRNNQSSGLATRCYQIAGI